MNERVPAERAAAAPEPDRGLTTHVLDASRGRPAPGVTVEVYRIEGPARSLVQRAITDAAGRCTRLLEPPEFRRGTYELVFHAAEYFRAAGTALPDPPFLDRLSVRIGVAGDDACHVPVVMTPWACSVYRGQ